MFIEYIWAHTERQAAIQIMRRIAKKQGVNSLWTINYFKEHPQGYAVEECKNEDK